MSRNTCVAIAAGLGTLFVAAPGLAQSDGGGTSNGAGIETIVVTAQRRPEKVLDVPGTLSVMSGDALKKAGVTTTRDLTAAFPGLIFSSQGPAAEPTIRGVTTSVSTPGAGAPIALYVDGLYQANQIGNLFDLPDVSQIQVLKGPQGTLWGRNATGGAILVSTLQPSFTPGGTVTVGDGVFVGDSARTSNDFTAQGFVTGPLIDNELAGSLAASVEEAPGYFTDDRTGRGFGKIDSFYVRGKLLYTPTDNLSITLSGSYEHRRDDAVITMFPLLSAAGEYPGAVLPTEPYHTTGEQIGGGNYLDTIHKDVSLAIDWTLPGAGVLSSRTGYTATGPIANIDVGAAYSPGCRIALVCSAPFAEYQPDHSFQQDLTFVSEKFGAFSFVAGAFYLHDSEDGFYNINPPIQSQPVSPFGRYGYFVFDENVTTNAAALYFEGSYNITDALTATVGGRLSYETKVEYARQSVFTFEAPTGPFLKLPPEGAPTDTAFTPKVALRYAIDPDTNIFASYNRGFKSSVLTGISLTAPAAKPETIDSFEIGVKHAGEIFSFDASAFYYKYKDLQEEYFNGLSTITSNAASATSYGFDADAAAQLTDNFQLQAGLSWIPYAKFDKFPNGIDYALPLTAAGLTQVTVDASGRRLLRDPQFTGNVTGDYSADTAWGFLNASATIYRSSHYDWDLLRRVRTPSYTTLNSQIALTPPGSSFTVAIYGQNLTNETYIVGVVGGAVGDQVIYSQPREVGVKITDAF